MLLHCAFILMSTSFKTSKYSLLEVKLPILANCKYLIYTRDYIYDPLICILYANFDVPFKLRTLSTTRQIPNYIDILQTNIHAY